MWVWSQLGTSWWPCVFRACRSWTLDLGRTAGWDGRGKFWEPGAALLASLRLIISSCWAPATRAQCCLQPSLNQSPIHTA